MAFELFSAKACTKKCLGDIGVSEEVVQAISVLRDRKNKQDTAKNKKTTLAVRVTDSERLVLKIVLAVMRAK